jgi:hypothetical protein
VFEMIAEALLISAGFGGADADLRGGVTKCRSGAAEGVGFSRGNSAAGFGFNTAAGGANASSANLSVTL